MNKAMAFVKVPRAWTRSGRVDVYTPTALTAHTIATTMTMEAHGPPPLSLKVMRVSVRFLLCPKHFNSYHSQWVIPTASLISFAMAAVLLQLSFLLCSRNSKRAVATRNTAAPWTPQDAQRPHACRTNADFASIVWRDPAWRDVLVLPMR